MDGFHLDPGDGMGSGEPTSGTNNSLAYIQLEKQNERLKEALIRFAALTSQHYAMSDLEVTQTT